MEIKLPPVDMPPTCPYCFNDMEPKVYIIQGDGIYFEVIHAWKCSCEDTLRIENDCRNKQIAGDQES